MTRNLKALHHSYAIFISKIDPDYNFGQTLRVSIIEPQSQTASVRFDDGVCELLEIWKLIGFSECEQYPLRHELLAYAEMMDNKANR